MQLKYKNLDYNDYITGNKFRDLCQFKFPGPIGDKGTVYCATDNVFECLDELKKHPGPFVLVTHNSDKHITTDMVKAMPTNIKRWYGQNMLVVDPLFVAIPIGIANPQWEHGNFDVIKNQLKQPYNKKNLCYMCNKYSTNVPERLPLYQHFWSKNYPWMVVKGDWDHQIPHKDFIQDVYASKFVVSPPGNGLDCLRTWEALYLGSIPIIKDVEAYSPLIDGLPVLRFNNLTLINKFFLDCAWDEALEKEWDMSKLTMNYWKARIESDNG